jgi:hypothetical protein
MTRKAALLDTLPGKLAYNVRISNSGVANQAYEL